MQQWQALRHKCITLSRCNKSIWVLRQYSPSGPGSDLVSVRIWHWQWGHVTFMARFPQFGFCITTTCCTGAAPCVGGGPYWAERC